MSSNSNQTQKSKFKQFLHGFIPKHVSNGAVVNVYDFLRVLQHMNPKDYSFNNAPNKDFFQNHREIIKKNSGFIEDQNNYTDMMYGKKTVRFCGCEVIATYNALYSIHRRNPISFSDMLTEYEKDGMVLSGYFGTSPKSICHYLNKHGYITEFTTKLSEFDRIGAESDSLILTIYNDGADIMKAVHTVNVSKENGRYVGHNVYGNGRVAGPYNSVTELMEGINNGKSKAISLIGVNVKRTIR